ncbi:MAG: hypothetical protein RLZZ252_1834 [Bacteroidota bacterium]
MFSRNSVDKPQIRSSFRRKLGRQYFILKRKLIWWVGDKKYAVPKERNASKIDSIMALKSNQAFQNPISIIKHKSFLLRPLKDVDMHFQHNKVVNLRIACNAINGTVIHPGETFSLWKLVGKPSKSKGYLEGLALHNGKIATDIGGGLCQLGNLLYWMVLHTPLQITERWRHGYDVFPDINRTIPFACGATLAYNYIDLQWINTTSDTFQLHVWLDETYLHGEICCNRDLQLQFEVFETDHQIHQQWWGGYTRHNKIWKRIIHSQTGEIQKELVSVNNAIMMYNPLLEN